MTFSRLNGAVLHWQASGPATAPPVVFANSLGSDLRIWDAVAARLVPDHRVIRYDLRGHGLSELPPARFGIGDHADDVAALLDVVGAEACALVGLSVGGMIALHLAAHRPARVRALVLCDAAARIGTPESWRARIDAVERGGLEAIADAVLDRWFTRPFREQRADEVAGWRTMLLRTPASGYAAVCAAIRDADLSGEAAAIRAPCLCVVGDEDGATPPELVRQTAAMIRASRFAVIAGAGHLPCIEQPDRLAALIRQHLTEPGHG